VIKRKMVFFSKGEMGEACWEMMNWLFEAGSKREMSESWREVLDRLIE